MDLRTSFLLMLLGAYYVCSESSNDEDMALFAPDYQQSKGVEDSTEVIKQVKATVSYSSEHIVDGKYTIYTEAASWLEALLICRAKGATLAVPRSREDATALGRLLLSASAIITGAEMRDAVHVGLTDSEVEGDWWTVGGLSVAATGCKNWLGGRLETNTSADCAALLADGLYIQVSCDAVLAFACEPQPTPAERSDGYVDIADIGTYKLHTEPLTWGEAGRRCAEEGATLAVPTSPRAAGLLAGILITAAADEKIRQEGFFVGINDLSSEGVWRTIFNDNLYSTGYATWAPGRPSGGRDNNCGALLADGRYGDYPCSKPMPFCCEMGGLSRKDDEPLATLGRYSLFVKELRWLSAEINCRRRNGTLAAPRDADEFHILHSLAGRHPKGNYYLHLGALYNGSEPVTNRKGESIFYSELGVPSNGRRSLSSWRYMVSEGKCIYYQSQSINMYISPCSEKRPYICESYSKI